MNITNENIKAGFEDMFSRTKTAAENISRKGSKHLSLSRKNVEYLDAKSKAGKAYLKYGQLMYLKESGQEVNAEELDVLYSEITAYRERMQVLESEISAAKEEIENDAKDFGKEIVEASKDVTEVFKKQASEVVKNAKEAFKYPPSKTDSCE
ncbi:MAG: hypothetical protein LUH82_04430 [Clostridiales bacterium]|nr:hypothetical protein [Clostridiales bacterium]